VPQLAMGGKRLNELQGLARKAGAGKTDDAKALNRRLEKLGTWQRKGQAVIPLLGKFFA